MVNIQSESRKSVSRPQLREVPKNFAEAKSFQSRSELGIITSERVLPFSRKASSPCTISNRYASSRLSLFATTIVILATSVASGELYAFAAGQRKTDVSNLWCVGVLIAIFFCSALRLSGGRQPLKTSQIFNRARCALGAWLVSFALFLAIAFTFKFGSELSRGATISFFLAGLVTVISSHMHIPIMLANLQRSSALIHRGAILIGAMGDVGIKRLVAEFEEGGCSEIHVVEFDAACSAMEWPRECKRLLGRVTALAHHLGPGEIYLTTPQIPPARTQSILRALTLIPRAVLVIPDELTVKLLRHRLSEVGNEITIDVQREPMNAAGRTAKRAIDIFLSSIAIAFFLPLFVFIAAAIKLDSAGPILFLQTRNGYQGRSFRILKFRTMTVMEDGDVVRQASKNDARTTRVGRFLRKTSLDELPQLFNVLRGEMSLIGPRPHARAHDAAFSKLIENYEIRQHVKPGITGWAQINGLRGETQTLDLMYRRIEFDLWYARNCSLFLDLRILAGTIVEVFRPRNAY